MRDYGWLECEFTEDSFREPNILVANAFSGGSIKTADSTQVLHWLIETMVQLSSSAASRTESGTAG